MGPPAHQKGIDFLCRRSLLLLSVASTLRRAWGVLSSRSPIRRFRHHSGSYRLGSWLRVADTKVKAQDKVAPSPKSCTNHLGEELIISPVTYLTQDITLPRTMQAADHAAYVFAGFRFPNFAHVHSKARWEESRTRTVTFRTRVRCQVREGNVDATEQHPQTLQNRDARLLDVSEKFEESGDSGAFVTGSGESTFSSALVAGMQAVLEDLLERPDYYVNAGGALLATFLAYVVMSTTIDALNHLPVIPDFLRLVGLLYSLWFMITYTLSPVARKELKRDVDDFVEVVGGGSATVEG